MALLIAPQNIKISRGFTSINAPAGLGTRSLAVSSKRSNGTQFRFLQCNAAGKGFAGKSISNSKSGSSKAVSVPKGWEDAGFTIKDLQEGKGKPFISKIAANDLAYCVFKVGEDVYATEANSTAFQYPLIDAQIIKGEDGLNICVPLDGTVYNLETGKVVEWCPQDNLLRKILGGLKKQVAPVNLKVFETMVGGNGEILVKLRPKDI